MLDRTQFNTFLVLNQTSLTIHRKKWMLFEENMDEQWSHAPLFIHFPITRSSRELLLVTCGCTIVNDGPTIEKLWWECYQTGKIVAAGEPHPQPQYQTATICLCMMKILWLSIYVTIENLISLEWSNQGQSLIWPRLWWIISLFSCESVIWRCLYFDSRMTCIRRKDDFSHRIVKIMLVRNHLSQLN